MYHLPLAHGQKVPSKAKLDEMNGAHDDFTVKLQVLHLGPYAGRTAVRYGPSDRERSRVGGGFLPT